jgi:hypothetical protein
MENQAFFHANDIFGKHLRRKTLGPSGAFGNRPLSNLAVVAIPDSGCCAVTGCCPVSVARDNAPVYSASGHFFRRPTSTGIFHNLAVFHG